MPNWFNKFKRNKEIFPPILKDKKDVFVLSCLLVLLILPRVAAYAVFGVGIVGTDGIVRYFPQVEQLSRSFGSFFSQTGPIYSLFLLFFEKISSDMVLLPVFFQHIIGIISALLVFYFFNKVNPYLAFVVTVFSFSVPMAIWLEHTILREALVSFFIILLVLFLFSGVKNNKYFKFSSGLLAGLLGLILIFLRIEFIILVVLMPLILFLIKKRNFPALKFKDKAFLRWILGYFCLFFVVFFIYSNLPQKPAGIGDYSSPFAVAFYNLQPDVFYYENSKYPELLERYQKILETTDKTVGQSLNMFRKETQDYLSGHPEIKLSVTRIMDKIYIEIITKNTFVYLKSFAINLKNHLFGTAEINSSITKNEYKTITGIYLIDKLLLFLNISMLILSWILFWLFLPALPLIFLKWKTLPDEVVISFLIGAVHIFVLAFFSNPAHRFRYALDPFIYFAQLYLIFILFKAMISKYKLLRKNV